MPDVAIAEDKPAAVKAKPIQQPLDHGRLKLEEHVRRSWFSTLDDRTPREAIFDPGYWKHHAAKMHVLDKICVTDDAGTFYLECLVVGLDQERAYIQQVFETSLVKSPQTDDGDLHVQWAGPHRRWEVVRGGKTLGGGHPTRAAAEIAMAGFAGGRV